MFISLIFGYMKQEVPVTMGFLDLGSGDLCNLKVESGMNSMAWLLWACSFLSGGWQLLLWWPVVPEFLVLSGYMGDCSSCLVYPVLGSDFCQPCPESLLERVGKLSCPAVNQACEGQQMARLSSEPPLFIMMKNDQPPGKWKSWPMQLWILVNDFAVNPERWKRSSFKLTICLPWRSSSCVLTQVNTVGLISLESILCSLGYNKCL